MKLRSTQSRRFRVLLLITLLLTGCQSARALQLETSPPDASTPPPQSPGLLGVGGQESVLLEAGSAGRLAYIGADGNVYVTTADGRSTIAVTNDAEAPPEQPGLSYHRIAWSSSGWLAFAAVTRQGHDAQGKLYVVDSPGRPARLVAESDQHFICYIHWSPALCPGRPDCQRLAYLTREDSDGGIGLHLVEIDADTVENRLLDVGYPVFFSWSGDGRRLLWHAGGDHRENPSARVMFYDVERDRVETLPHAPGPYLAPALSSVGENWLGVSSEGGQNQLQSFGPDGATRLLTISDEEIVFSWSPTGEQVAYALRRKGAEGVYGPIHLFDLETGGTRPLTNERFQTLGFFWSPDGQRLGYLIRLDLPDSDWAQWRTVDWVSGQDRGFAAFSPSPWMWFVINGFGQHAQSHNFWSPDGRFLVYSDRDELLVDRVWRVDIWAQNGAKPTLVAKGVIAGWSWD